MKQRSTSSKKLSALLFGAVFFFCLLAAAEILARTKWGPPAPETTSSDFDYFHLQIHEKFFKKERQADGTYRYRTQRDRTGGEQSFAARKGRNTFRVFVIGGSVAMGFNAHESSRLGEFLRRAVPGREFEIVGCGMGAYDSYRESLVEKEVLDYDPDLIVLLSGNNEYVSGLRVDLRFYRINSFLRRSQAYRAVQDRFASHLAEPALTLNDRLRQFEGNLQLMIRRARKRGVPMVLCTLPVNIRDVPPISVQAPASDPSAISGRLALDKHQYAEASRKFSAFLALHPANPFGYYWRAQAEDRAGAFDAARLDYQRAVDLDDPGERCSPRRNAAIRAQARVDGVVVADVADGFARLVPHGLVDSRLIKDHVHWYNEYDPLVSLIIVKAIGEHDLSRRDSILAPSSLWDLRWVPEIEKTVSHPAITSRARARYAREIFMTAVSGVFKRNRVQESAISYFVMADRLDRGICALFLSSRKPLELEISVNPWLGHLRGRLQDEWPRVLLHAGEAYRRMGRNAQALALLNESLRLAPENVDARRFRFLLDSSLGNKMEARTDLSRLARSGDPDTLSWIARWQQ